MPFQRFFRLVSDSRPEVSPPPELRSYCDLLLAELETLVEDATEYSQEAPTDPLTWAKIYSLHRRIIRRYDLARLKRALWDVRDRYQDAFGAVEFAEYMKSNPPDPAQGASREELIADLDQLLGRLYARYSLSGFADASRKSISRKLVRSILWGVVFLVVCLVGAWYSGSVGGSTIAAVVFAGTIGGFVSFLQRIQAVSGGSDPLNSILLFQTTRFTFLYTSPLAGAVFASVLYFALLGNLISGAVFPVWDWPGKTPTQAVDRKANEGGSTATGSPSDSTDPSKRVTLIAMLSRAHPQEPKDYALLLVWCFLAGFLERWVPDNLSRIANRTESADTKPA